MVVGRGHELFELHGIRRAPKGQLPSLTPLRGSRFSGSVLYHYSVQDFPNLDATHYTHLIGKGYLAVDMFFMLSGFVMTTCISGHSRIPGASNGIIEVSWSPASRAFTRCMSLCFCCSWRLRSRRSC